MTESPKLAILHTNRVLKITVDLFLAKFSGYFSYFPLYIKILHDTLIGFEYEVNRLRMTLYKPKCF